MSDADDLPVLDHDQAVAAGEWVEMWLFYGLV
jgi:hypothetical protein